MLVTLDHMFIYCEQASQVCIVHGRICIYLSLYLALTFLPGTKPFQLWLMTYIVIGLSLIRQSKGLPSQSTSVSLHSNWRIDSEYRNIYKQLLPSWFGDTLKRTLCFSQRRGGPRIVFGKRRAVGAGRWQAGASGCTSSSCYWSQSRSWR